MLKQTTAETAEIMRLLGNRVLEYGGTVKVVGRMGRGCMGDEKEINTPDTTPIPRPANPRGAGNRGRGNKSSGGQ